MDLNSELQDLLAECYKDTAVFAKVFFPERFSSPFSQLHHQIFELIDARNPDGTPANPRIAIAAPRGIGKTSIVGLALAGKRLLFQDSRFFCHVSTSFDVACMQTENLKRELITNPIIRKLFGPVKARNANSIGMDESFSKKAWATSGGGFVLPRGAGQQVRGVLFKDYRPDLIVVDDLEDPDLITNEENRKKLAEWFDADLLKCTSRIDKNHQIVYIDTLKHADSLLQGLLDSSGWTSIRLEICGDDLKSNVPEFMSDEDIKKDYDYYKERGQLDIWYREMRNLPISTEDAVFRQEYFQYLSVGETDDVKDWEYIIICDPAKTVKMQSADSALVGIGLSRSTSKIWIRDVCAGKMYPDELYHQMFEMAARLGARVVGVEVTSLNEFIKQPIKNEMHRRGHFFELVELKARGKKEERIASLSPYYRQGFIYHNPTCSLALEGQLLAFPRGKRVDIIDAEGYVVEMMELGTRYFEPINSPYDGDPESEFTELEAMDEKPVDDWRVA
jgi:hypothetical protein